MRLTPVANGKNLRSEEVFNILVGHLWVVDIDNFFSLSSLEGLSILITFPLFAISVLATGGKLTTGVIDTSGKFAACVVDTGGAY